MYISAGVRSLMFFGTSLSLAFLYEPESWFSMMFFTSLIGTMLGLYSYEIFVNYAYFRYITHPDGSIEFVLSNYNFHEDDKPEEVTVAEVPKEETDKIDCQCKKDEDGCVDNSSCEYHNEVIASKAEIVDLLEKVEDGHTTGEMSHIESQLRKKLSDLCKKVNSVPEPPPKEREDNSRFVRPIGGSRYAYMSQLSDANTEYDEQNSITALPSFIPSKYVVFGKTVTEDYTFKNSLNQKYSPAHPKNCGMIITSAVEMLKEREADIVQY
jgi:hypothetical protein